MVCRLSVARSRTSNVLPEVISSATDCVSQEDAQAADPPGAHGCSPRRQERTSVNSAVMAEAQMGVGPDGQKKRDEDSDDFEYSPFWGIEKGAVLQEARCFNESQLDARRCQQVRRRRLVTSVRLPTRLRVSAFVRAAQYLTFAHPTSARRSLPSCCTCATKATRSPGWVFNRRSPEGFCDHRSVLTRFERASVFAQRTPSRRSVAIEE